MFRLVDYFHSFVLTPAKFPSLTRLLKGAEWKPCCFGGRCRSREHREGGGRGLTLGLPLGFSQMQVLIFVVAVCKFIFLKIKLYCHMVQSSKYIKQYTSPLVNPSRDTLGKFCIPLVFCLFLFI